MTRRIRSGYAAFDKEGERDRLAAFEASADRLGTIAAITEKDFWVCRTIDFLFNGRGDRLQPTMTFRGGTSLSKGYGLIHRFSEDVDVVLSVPGLYDRKTTNPFQHHVSKAKMPAVMTSVLQRAEGYVHGELCQELEAHFGPLGCVIKKLPSDAATIALGLEYPRLAGRDAYISTDVLIQFCVRAEPEPHSPAPITPYIARHLRGEWDLKAIGVRTLRPSRTFVEKLFAMHEAASKYEKGVGNITDKNRLSRHYYDVAMMQGTVYAERALAGTMFAKVAANQEYRWSQRSWILKTAKRGTLKILPPDGLRERLEADYRGMQNMMFSNPPSPTFEEVLSRLNELDRCVNSASRADT
ncbi:MAG: nucleotidyl transferase AbiEii/AbiGii toxin family protein [Terricaulis silvestris]